MRVCINQYIRIRPVIDQNFQNTIHVPPFLRAGKQFTIRESPGPSFPETVIRIFIRYPGFVQTIQILFPLFHAFPSLQNNRSFPQLDQTQSRKQTSRPGTHHDHRPGRRNIPVLGSKYPFLLFHPIQMNTNFQLNNNPALTGVY